MGQVGQESNLQPAVLEDAALRLVPSHAVSSSLSASLGLAVRIAVKSSMAELPSMRDPVCETVKVFFLERASMVAHSHPQGAWKSVLGIVVVRSCPWTPIPVGVKIGVRPANAPPVLAGSSRAFIGACLGSL